MTEFELILNDDTSIENGTAGLADGYLWLYFSGYTFADVVTLFCDTEKTQKIIYRHWNTQDEYNGYIQPISITVNINGGCSVCMKKDGGNNGED